MRTSLLTGLALLVAACSGGPGVKSATGNAAATKPSAVGRKHVFVISVDGLMPDAYMHPDRRGLKIPTLRKLRAGGAYSPGVLSVFPSVTYPSHTSMVTGVNPGRHGITTNRQFDPLLKNKDGWRWYAEQIKVPTLYQVARAAGLHTALINWPVTVGAKADYRVPEYWRAGTPDDQRLERALSTPGLLQAVAAKHADFWQRFAPPEVKDSASIDIALHLLRKHAPDLMLIHIWNVDDWQHRKGPWSPEARAAIERADAQIARFIAAVKAAGIWRDSVVMVVSDHGFLAVEHTFRPGVVIDKLGLRHRNKDGKVDKWKASVLPAGGMCYVHVNGADAATKTAVRAALQNYVGPDKPIRKLYDAAEIRARGGDPSAFLAMDANTGWEFGRGYTGKLTQASHGAGNHGYDPKRPELRASLLIYGPSIEPAVVHSARIIDIGPTAAQLLGLRLSKAEGTPLLAGATGR